MKFLKEWLPYIIILAVVLLIRMFIITPARVNGESMESTLYDGEIVLLNKISLSKGINRFDIVVFDYEDDLLIKRVIGLPGETIEYKDNKLYINGKETELPLEFENTKDFKDKVSENSYYLLGDNRDNSKDSRYIGEINIKDIKGKVRFVLFPFKKFGAVK